MLAPPMRSLGRGRGTVSEAYPREALAQAITIIELLDCGVILSEMPVAMVVRSAPIVSIEAVRQSYLSMLPAASGSDEERDSQAEELSARWVRRARRYPLLHHWSRRARQVGSQVKALIKESDREAGHSWSPRALLGVMFTVIGDQNSTVVNTMSWEAFVTTSRILGTSLTETWRIFVVIKCLTTGALRETARDVTIGELQQARERLLSLLSDVRSGPRPDFRSAGLILLGLVAVDRKHPQPCAPPK